jgi:general secretion pathway protein E
VLSTVHTNDAPSTVNRLLDMGVEDYLLTSTIIGILAQRLVRTLCQQCKEPYVALPELGRADEPAQVRARARHHAVAREGLQPVRATPATSAGSDHGVLPMTDPLRSLVMKHATATDLRAEAIRGGMLTMYEDGVRKALKGVTTFEEVLRVTREN